jgi:hypothetical protein
MVAEGFVQLNLETPGIIHSTRALYLARDGLL